MKAPPVSLDDEVRHLVNLYAGDAPKIMAAVQSQLGILSMRAQVLLQLAGITITVTGFSGANIARTGPVAAAFLVSGLVVVLIAASLAMNGILRVEWTTRLAPCPMEFAVRNALEIRDEKTGAYARALRLLILGLTLYVTSVGMLLLGNLPRT